MARHGTIQLLIGLMPLLMRYSDVWVSTRLKGKPNFKKGKLNFIPMMLSFSKLACLGVMSTPPACKPIIRLIKVLICTTTASDRYLSGCTLIIRFLLINFNSLFSIWSYKRVRAAREKALGGFLSRHPSDLLFCCHLMLCYFKKKRKLQVRLN